MCESILMQKQRNTERQRDATEIAEIKVLHLTSMLYKGQRVTTAHNMRSEMWSITCTVFMDIEKYYELSTASIQGKHKCSLREQAPMLESFAKGGTQKYHHKFQENL